LSGGPSIFDPKLQLVATKLRPPLLRPSLVERPRLLRGLDAAARGKLSLVSAPAGFGKTTLLLQWRERLRRGAVAVGWLNIDADDNDAGRFLSHLAGALSGADRRLGGKALALLRSSPVLPVDAALTALINEIAEFGRRVVLILDDYHLVKSARVHQAVETLIAYAPAQFHLALASRSAPPLAAARLRLQGLMVDLRDCDLRFSLEETTAFLNESHALDLSHGDIIRLQHRTEGWVAALQLASISLDRRVERTRFIQNFSGTDRDITDYLASDVLMRQPQALRDFLLKTSVLERMSADLCDHVAGLSNSAETLARIERGNLFLVALDEDRRWFRYHHLFADFLRSQLRRRGPGLEVELHRRAAAWFAASGAMGDAIHHALQAGDPAWAAEKLEALALDMVKQSHVTRLQEWLRKLPPEVVAARPRLLLSEVWATFHISRPLEAARALVQAKQALGHSMAAGRLSPAEQLLQQAELRMLTAGVVSAANRPGLARRMAARWRDDMPPDHPFLIGTLSNIYAFNSYLLADLPEAREASRRARASHEEARSIFGILYADIILALVEKAEGKLASAASILERARSAVREALGPGSYAEALGEVFLGEIRYEWGDLAGAARLLRGSYEAVGEAATVVHEVTYRFCLARLEAAEGRLDAALALLDEPTRMARYPRFRRSFAALAHERVRLVLQRGDLTAARVTLLGRGLDPDQMPTAPALDCTTLAEFDLMALARLWLAEGRRGEAEALLEGLAVKAAGQGRQRRAFTLRLLQSIGRLEGGAPASAVVRPLIAVLPLARREGFLRGILDEGAAARRLVDLAQSEAEAWPSRAALAEARPYLEKLAAAFTGRPAEPGPEASALLSRRELDVVRLLGRGHSNRRLAGELAMAPDTVKWHLKNIFGKLGVASRSQAILEAQRRGLLV
jgi:LuxR family transcriptional regulator, maltose regulon positive regulatory protein